ncbi:MAG: hypothetical protein JSR83_23260 [Proteobacteria bacterium]|nr:hypothetical protein [Pseudomonadota bacterium]
MAKLLVLPNKNLIDPTMIHGVIRFPNKGIALRNEYNKICDFLKYPDEREQRIIIEVLHRILNTRDWEQPDWDAEFATAP